MKAIWFDLFETLITEFANGVRKVPRMAALDERWGLSLQEYNEAWNSRQAQRMDGTFPDHPSVLRDIWASKGINLEEAHIQSLYQARLAAKEVPFQVISSDVLYLLKQLKSRGYLLGLISNCTEEEVRAWDSCPLAPYFDAALFSYRVGYAKPDLSIYELACRQLSLTPEQAIFVGDGGSRELEGAVAAGLQAYQATWFTPPFISDRISGFPKLLHPHELLEHL